MHLRFSANVLHLTSVAIKLFQVTSAALQVAIFELVFAISMKSVLVPFRCCLHLAACGCNATSIRDYVIDGIAVPRNFFVIFKTYDTRCILGKCYFHLLFLHFHVQSEVLYAVFRRSKWTETLYFILAFRQLEPEDFESALHRSFQQEPKAHLQTK